MFFCFTTPWNIDFHMVYLEQVVSIHFLQKCPLSLALCPAFVSDEFSLNATSCTCSTEYHPFFFFSRPFLLKLLWIFNLPSSEHRLPSPCTLISLEHILFNLADCLGSYWIVLFQGWSLSEPSQHSILVFTVSYWKLLSKCSFVLVNFPC